MDRKEFFNLAGKGMFGGALVLSGCSDLLNQNNPNTLTPKNFWKSADDAKAGVTAIYQKFLGEKGWAASDNWYNRLVPSLYRSDDIGITRDVPSWWSIAQFDLTASNNQVNRTWNDDYVGIFRANQVIENVSDIEMDESLKGQYMGEAKFMRAFFYINLVTIYKNVPLRLQAKAPDSNYSLEQSPPEDTWTQIEKDLSDAMGSLPATYDASNLGRVTKGAAMGYLGMAYLYQQKWSEAVSVFDQIINSGNYALVPQFKDVFAIDNEFNEETLLEINFSNAASKGETPFTPRNREEGLTEAGGWYECFPNAWLLDQMTTEKTASGEFDPRVYHTIAWKDSGMKYYGKSYDELLGTGATKMGWMKYSEAELGESISQYSGKNCRLLRFADILLMHAEATIRSGGAMNEAMNSINKVRNRADLEALSAGMSQTEMLEQIEHQRICELADEGKRWYDLLRWGGNITQSMSIKEVLMDHSSIGGSNFVPGKHEYFPIPQDELQTNTKAVQNEGY